MKLSKILESSSKYKDLAVQFIKFGIVGVSNTLISLAIYYIFVWISKDLYMWGNVVGWVVSVFNAFYWNNKYVFKSEKQDWKSNLTRLAKNYLTYGSTFLLSTALLFVEVNFLHVSEWIAPIINLLITIPLNFLLNKFWAFRK